MKSIIEYSHKLFEDFITKDDVVIDMTVGNGNDTLFLVDLAKFVYGFDIQKEACEKTSELLKDYDNFKIINDSHLNFDNYVNEKIKGVIFNLGYLPSGSKDICTNAYVVLDTVIKVLNYIDINGICVIVFYPGHKSGMEEVMVLMDFLKQLNQKEYDVLKYEFINQINNPPFLVAIRRKK